MVYFMYNVMLVQAADSLTAFLSNGLGALVGTIIANSKSFIAKAKILRKTIGGGMTQVVVLCAPTLVALEENVSKLEGYHQKAKILAEGLNKIKELKVDMASVQTNIVYFDILKGSNIMETHLCKILVAHGVVTMLEGPFELRLVIYH
ncbi:putative low-specificity L-threonine aldolase 2 [Abeliophyllum distichum]|uniref:Low-specificity L-threonine aldolase 2 n=1 Tax=Abeliophyllum distichum TaxID=126358 RepID=A0ABD1UQQ4_9LAMI